jgi:heavy metal sensor kinase
MNIRSIRFRLTAWYAGLLSGLLILFAVFIYFTLEHFLEINLRETLSREAQTIGEALLRNVNETGEAYVVKEMEEHFAPRITSRFLRVTHSDGSLLYESGPPQNHAFDPSQIPSEQLKALQNWREEQLPDGSSLLIYSISFVDNAGKRYLIEAGTPYEQVQSVLHQLLFSLAIALPLIVGIAIGGGYWLMRRVVRPLDEIATTAERITSRNLNERVPVVATGDEIETLAISLNRMMARLEESFHHINRFSADASHEIRTPLAIIRAELENAHQTTEMSTEMRETVRSTLEEAERLSRIVEQLLEISRLEAGETLVDRTRFDFAEMTRATVEQMRLLAEEKGQELIFGESQSLAIEGDHMRLRQIVVNLVDNAIKYTPAGGSIYVTNFAFEGKAVLEVADTGLGVPSEAAAYIFDRFYRVDKARSRQLGGAGLGLAIVKSICLAYGGTISLRHSDGPGAVFRVELPLDPSHDASRHPLASAKE